MAPVPVPVPVSVLRGEPLLVAEVVGTELVWSAGGGGGGGGGAVGVEGVVAVLVSLSTERRTAVVQRDYCG